MASFASRAISVVAELLVLIIVDMNDGYQLLLLAGCFENFRVLSYVFIV